MLFLVDPSDLKLRSLRIVICSEKDNVFEIYTGEQKVFSCKTGVEASCNRTASRTQQEKFWGRTHRGFSDQNN